MFCCGSSLFVKLGVVFGVLKGLIACFAVGLHCLSCKGSFLGLLRVNSMFCCGSSLSSYGVVLGSLKG